MTTRSTPLITDGVAAAGILALAVTIAIGAAGVGMDVLEHLVRQFGAIGMITAVSFTPSMSLVGVVSVASLALAMGLATLDGARDLLARRPGSR